MDARAKARDLAAEGFVKVRMSDSDGFTETAWAQRRSPGEDVFRLDNAPFYAYRVSADDFVEGSLSSEGMYDFVRVVERSGNRTVRLMFGDEKADTPFGEEVLSAILALGCSFEGKFNKLMSITVPPSVSLDAVATYLTSTGLQWEYADPKYEDLFDD
jgi:hypothetical protein